ncbi:MAG: DUF2892 domain-containing protein [Gammaproteobacteria bacterium]|nr:DUF2892 domain-containing protein [Gammaproteobacteria bacterium]
MNKNVGQVDRIIRITTGVVCAYIALLNPFAFTNTILSVVVGVFAAINLLTALFSFCPMYQMSGISTRKK